MNREKSSKMTNSAFGFGFFFLLGTFDEKLVSHSESGGKPVKVTAKDKGVN